MCGIAGVLLSSGEPVPEGRVAGMLDEIAHRGPDGRGVWVDRGIGLGHVRLSILDLSEMAAQPMVSHCGRYVLSFNGEIFNYRELRAQLKDRGKSLRSTGDTEVLLELLATVGAEKILPQLEGFFGLALWDNEERSLLLARDRHGIKPLYVKPLGTGVEFASEIKPLVAPEAPVDPHAISATLLGWGSVLGGHTPFKDVSALPPGNWARYRAGAPPQRGAFFTVADFIDPELYRELQRARDEEVLDRLAAAFDASVDLRMISDAPVACLASGGVDSNFVVATASGKTSEPMPLYHASVAHNSERPFAEAIAAELGLELNCVEVSDEMYLDNLPIATRHNELPVIYHPNSVPFYLVCQRASRDGIKVVLTGEGSDEYFLGYPWFIIGRYTGLAGRAMARAQDLVHKLFPRGASILWPRGGDSYPTQLSDMLFRYLPEDLQDQSEDLFAHIEDRRDREAQVEVSNLIHGHLGTVLHRNDRLGMASGIESRFPFLGHEFARLGINAPSRYKIRVTRRFYNVRHPFNVDKWAVRKIAERRLADRFVYRPKKGFPISIESRMEVDPAFFVDGCVQEWYGLGRKALERLADRSSPAWVFRLMMLEVWGQTMWRQLPLDEIRGSLHRGVRFTAPPA